ncbi:MAG: signal peptidase II [Gemmatimonadales bacterium]
MPQRSNRFWTIFLTTVLIDVATKRIAVSELSPPYVPHTVIDDVLRFTLAYNPEGAMSFSLGPSSRWWFVLLSLGTLGVLAYLYKQTPRDDRIQIASIALICGGAVGNLLDRLRSARGVVDFIDIGIGTHRFWTFNIADLAVTLGTAMLTWILCVRAARDERAAHGLAPAPTRALDEPS